MNREPTDEELNEIEIEEEQDKIKELMKHIKSDETIH